MTAILTPPRSIIVIGSNAGSFHSVSRMFCARNGKPSLLDDFLHALGAERELPMPDHGVGLEQRHAVDHVLALALQRRVAVLPGVAAVEEHDAVAALGADRLEDGGDAVEPADPAVGSWPAPRNPRSSAHRPPPSPAGIL